jgi:hypothetical protein
LLIEEGRTNLLQHSANFKNTTSSNYWENLSATTVTVDQTTSPDGGVNADLLSTSTSTFDCFTRRGNFWAGSTQYTYSIFVKRGPSNYRYVGFYVGAGTSSTQFPYFDFDNPTTVQVPTITSGTINSTGVDAYPNGWYRIRITFTTAVTPIANFAGVYISSSSGSLQGVNPAGNDCYIWGIQSELGSFPTSYIPTTTGSVVRSADVCSITGDAFSRFYNQPEGTLFAGVTPQSVAQTGVVLGVNTTTFNNSHFICKGNSAFSASGLRWIGQSYEPLITIPSTLDAANAFAKIAYAYKSGSLAMAYNNILAGTSAITFTSINPTAMRIGARDDGLSINGHISEVKYFKKRLPDAKIQALTA